MGHADPAARSGDRRHVLRLARLRFFCRRRQRAGFWKSAILVLPQHDSLAKVEEIPLLDPLSAADLRCRRHRRRPISSTSSTRRSRCVSHQRFRELYLFLLNKWYFDELYDWLFVRPAMAIGDGLWKSGDGAVIDGLGPNGLAAVTRDLAQAGEPAADRLSLPLRLRHDDRACGVRDLVSVAALSEGH